MRIKNKDQCKCFKTEMKAFNDCSNPAGYFWVLKALSDMLGRILEIREVTGNVFSFSRHGPLPHHGLRACGAFYSIDLCFSVV